MNPATANTDRSTKFSTPHNNQIISNPPQRNSLAIIAPIAGLLDAQGYGTLPQVDVAPPNCTAPIHGSRHEVFRSFRRLMDRCFQRDETVTTITSFERLSQENNAILGFDRFEDIEIDLSSRGAARNVNFTSSSALGLMSPKLVSGIIQAMSANTPMTSKFLSEILKLNFNKNREGELASISEVLSRLVSFMHTSCYADRLFKLASNVLNVFLANRAGAQWVRNNRQRERVESVKITASEMHLVSGYAAPGRGGAPAGPPYGIADIEYLPNEAAFFIGDNDDNVRDFGYMHFLARSCVSTGVYSVYDNESMAADLVWQRVYRRRVLNHMRVYFITKSRSGAGPGLDTAEPQEWERNADVAYAYYTSYCDAMGLRQQGADMLDFVMASFIHHMYDATDIYVPYAPCVPVCDLLPSLVDSSSSMALDDMLDVNFHVVHAMMASNSSSCLLRYSLFNGMRSFNDSRNPRDLLAHLLSGQVLSRGCNTTALLTKAASSSGYSPVCAAMIANAQVAGVLGRPQFFESMLALGNGHFSWDSKHIKDPQRHFLSWILRNSMGLTGAEFVGDWEVVLVAITKSTPEVGRDAAESLHRLLPPGAQDDASSVSSVETFKRPRTIPGAAEKRAEEVLKQRLLLRDERERMARVVADERARIEADVEAREDERLLLWRRQNAGKKVLAKSVETRVASSYRYNPFPDEVSDDDAQAKEDERRREEEFLANEYAELEREKLELAELKRKADDEIAAYRKQALELDAASERKFQEMLATASKVNEVLNENLDDLEVEALQLELLAAPADPVGQLAPSTSGTRLPLLVGSAFTAVPTRTPPITSGIANQDDVGAEEEEWERMDPIPAYNDPFESPVLLSFDTLANGYDVQICAFEMLDRRLPTSLGT